MDWVVTSPIDNTFPTSSKKERFSNTYNQNYRYAPRKCSSQVR